MAQPHMRTFVAISFLLLSNVASAENPRVHGYRFGDGLTVSREGRYRLNLSGYVQPSLEVQDYLGSGPEGLNPRFRLRRLRLRLVGDAPQQKLSFRLHVDLSGSSEVGDEASNFLLDAFVAFRPTRTLRIVFGQRTTYTDNRELFIRSHALQFVERSRVTSAFSAIREVGLFVDDRIRIGETSHYLRPYLVITNGDGPNTFSADHGGLKFGGRVDYLPFGLFYDRGQFREVDLVRELVPRLVVGVAYSYNFGVSSRRGRGSGEIIYLNDQGEESLPDFGKFGLDFMFKYRGFSILGEFNWTHARVPDDITQRVRNDGSIATTFTGGVDAFVRGRMMLGRGYNLQLGYIFDSDTSVDLRYTHLDADENSFLNNGTFYNRPNYYTLGLSQYFTNRYGFKVQASLTFVDTNPGTNDFFSQPTDGDELIGRFMSTLAF
ncbi:MAG: porin [Myxococcota bacterium]